MPGTFARSLLAVAAIIVPLSSASAESGPKLDVSADVRLRAEQDWDSQTAAGVKRADRARLRLRARLNAGLDLGGGLKLLARVRTGGTDSQQNANITFKDFDGNAVDTLNVAADRYSLQYQAKNAGVEVGRMPLPFFTQNEYLWDGDINPLGGAVNGNLVLDLKTKLRLNAGAFALPAGLSQYSGQLYAGQAVLTHGRATLAGGLFVFDADPGDSDRLRQLNGNGERDYSVLAINAQIKLAAGGKPLVLGGDLYRNLKDYAASADSFSRANNSQRTGYVLSAAWGDTSAKGKFQLGYRYSRIERLAVNASYAHDDVARLGTAAQAALTDLKGHDLYANYAVTKSLIVGFRAMFMQRITSIEDGKRARLDIAYSF